MKKTILAVALALTVAPSIAQTPEDPIQYGIPPINVRRYSNEGKPNWSLGTVGIQANSTLYRGVNQWAFGIATEAWADYESFGMLTGIEATTINRNPDNPYRKISFWSTFKNRSDIEYNTPPADPANMGSQALRIESQMGTGFERAIVFAKESMHPSRNEKMPIIIDFSEMTMETMGNVVLMRFPDGYCEYYAGRGAKVTRLCNTPATSTPTLPPPITGGLIRTGR